MCVARCICCGAECACCCFRCCAGCCGSGRGKKSHKRVGSEPNVAYPPAYPQAYPPPPIDSRPPNEQYRSHAAPTISPMPAYRAPEPERPQFATFETPSKPVHEDSLPAMPEWGAAKSTHVEEEVIPEKRGDVELDRFDQNGSVVGASLSGTTAIGATRTSPGSGRPLMQRSPTGDSYGFPREYQEGAIANGPPRRSPHNSPGPYGAQYGQQQYRNGSPAQSLSPVQGPGGGYAQNQQYGRSSPSQPNNQQYNRSPQNRSPAPQSQNGYGYAPSDVSYGMDNTTPNNGYAPPQSQAPGYGAPARSNTPGYGSPARSNTPGYAAPPSAAYPGQQTYQQPAEPSYPEQPTYRAFTPGVPQGQQQSGVARRPINGSWKEV
ncbi:hypothetical protein K504DRAFT_371808 [Pleomassaria siparia CBS 279.74]|uniref:Uncharacterized protein n=1 Tax=Pleomassaria siparia CBS 279.74 TaxID=1314801 RepID=A0A6G1KJ35_9PLEO|nr:hypothetical protein K504DRAFT_371808 [Pleomassaria siparia CBS 279.74]